MLIDADPDAMNGRTIGADGPRALEAAAGHGMTTDRPPSRADAAEPAYLAAHEEHDRAPAAWEAVTATDAEDWRRAARNMAACIEIRIVQYFRYD